MIEEKQCGFLCFPVSLTIKINQLPQCSCSSVVANGFEKLRLVESDTLGWDICSLPHLKSSKQTNAVIRYCWESDNEMVVHPHGHRLSSVVDECPYC